MPVTSCPRTDELVRHLLGQLSEADSARVDAHLAGCPKCLSAAATLEATDPLYETVRRVAGENPTPLPPVVDPHALRLCRIASLSEEKEPGPPDGRVGPYRVDGILGRGGMGVVYLARHDRLNRPVALKMLPVGASPDRVSRFRREAEAVAALRHPNIVQLYEVGETDGRPYLVMEYVPGGSLAEQLAVAPLRPADAAQLVEAAARAVEAAHRQGVIHRDLKPGNVLLDPPAGPKLTDFGLAKYREPDPAAVFETESGALLGTPGYMAPEQAAGREEVGPGADVYGLGAVLYECLTGRPPFRAATVLDTLDQVRTLDPVPPGRLEPHVPRDLETVCLKCLEKDPSRRYPSAAALADDLGRFLRGEPVRARPAGVGRRAWKWARRRPTTAALTAAFGLAVAALASVTAVYTSRLRETAVVASANAGEADRQRGLAANNYRSARDALKRMLRRLDDRRADEIARLRELRRDQLEDALAFYQGVLSGPAAADPAVRLDSALAAAEAGEIQFSLGRERAAVETFHLATALFEGLPDEFRARPECRTGLVHCYNHLAHLSGGRTDETERYFLQARGEAGELVRADPSDPLRQDALARVEHNLGQFFWARQRTDRATEHYARAIEIRTGLLDRSGSGPIRAELGEDLLNLGLVYQHEKQADRAAAAYRRAEDLLRPFAEADPTNDRYALSLAGVYVNWGNLLRFSGDAAGGIAKFDRAVALADAVLRRDPEYTTARERATEAHGARAYALAAANRPAEAVPDWDRVVELVSPPDRPRYRAYRAAALAASGRYTRAVTEAHELAAMPGITDDDRYNVACALALAVEPARSDPRLGALGAVAAADAHARGAVQLLRGLHAGGYFRPPDRARLLADDPDLNAIRARPDFRLLAAEGGGLSP